MQDALTIKVRYLSDKIQPLEYIDGKSDWVDLRAAEDVELKAGEFKLIPLGIAMQLPKGYEAIVRSDINKSLYTMILWCLMSCDRCAANLYGVKS